MMLNQFLRIFLKLNQTIKEKIMENLAHFAKNNFTILKNQNQNSGQNSDLTKNTLINRFKPNYKSNTNVIDKENILITKEINYLIKDGDGVWNTPPEDLEFAITKVNVHGFDMEAMFDSGARFSILSISMVKKYNLPYEQTPTSCIMANGDTTSTFGETNLKIICHGSASELNFLILERKNILLGVDWFKANKAYVILHENSLVFDKRQILLNSTENNSENEINIIETDLTKFVQDEYEYLEEWPMPSENLDKNLLLSNESNLDEKTFEKLKNY